MARDPLRTLQKLRRMAVDGARQELVRCEQYEQALGSHIRACADAIASSELGSTDRGGLDASIAALHSYIDKMQRRASLLAHHVPPAQARTQNARSGLAQARMAEKAVSEISAKREQEVYARNLQLGQHELDDISRGSRHLARPDGEALS